jgi:hypothetical protein
MKKLITILLVTICTIHTEVSVGDQKSDKVKKIFTSTPAKIIYGLTATAITGAIGLVLFRKPLMAKINYERSWRAGRDAIYALEGKWEDKIVREYFNGDDKVYITKTDHDESIIYKFYLDPNNFKGEGFQDRFDELKKASKEKYADLFKRLHDNIKAYNDYCILEHKKAYSVGLDMWDDNNISGVHITIPKEN